MNRVFIITTLTFCCSLVWGQKYEHIVTKEKPEIDTFFNKYIIEDKYRWLENSNSSETKEWLEQQNKTSKKYLSKAVNKTNAYYSIDEYACTKYDNPMKMGDYYFSYAFYNQLAVPALFYQSKLDETPRILVDPNFISMKDKIMLNDYAVSKDSKLLAYQFSRNGSDWNEAKVISLKSGIDKGDNLKGLKFSHIEWRGNGFFYTTFSQEGQFGETHGQKLLYHKIGTEQQQDTLIYEVNNDSPVQLAFQTTTDERFFVLEEKDEQTGIINIYYIDFKSELPCIKPLLKNLKKYDINIIDSHEGKLIAAAFEGSGNGFIVEIDPLNPLNWRAISAEFADAILLNVMPFADRIIAAYQTNQRPLMIVYDYSGTILYHLQFPVASSIKGFSGSTSDEELLYSYNSYTIPPVVYKFNIKTFKKELTEKTLVTFDFENIEYKEVEYLSKDSIKVPMILVYEKGIKQDGNNPAILEAYGGFGVVEHPSFDPGIVYFIKQGGIYAFANIRGGGDKGLKWAKDGKGNNKQNSFDDFIAGAEYLIQNKYTNKDKLAITGASNGGLVVAAAAIQRPDLFKAVVPIVAPLDMLRFEKFTVGHWLTDEYGTVKDSTSFTRLLSYSPYHNIREDINYPAMLIVTSENDDRVPPFNSYKFVAGLQSRSAQLNPILLKVEKNAGHNGASTWISSISSEADIYGFIMNELMKK